MCKIFGPKIRSCKFFDKSQVCGDDGDDDGGGCELCKLDHQELLTKSLALHQRLKYHIDNNDDGVDDGGGSGGDDDDITC